MAASAPETTAPGRVSGRLDALLLGLMLLGAALLIVAEFLPLYEIRAITAVPEGGEHSTGAHHGYALLVVRARADPDGVGRGARRLAPGGDRGGRAGG